MNGAFDVIRNATLSVDSFFFMSGVLLSFITLKEMDALKRRSKDGDISNVSNLTTKYVLHLKEFLIMQKSWLQFWTLYYLSRYLRLTGVMVMICGLHATILHFWFPGHLQFMFYNMLDWCQNNIQWNILYVNNFVHKSTMVRNNERTKHFITRFPL